MHTNPPQCLPLWKRSIIVLYVMTLPIWFLPTCVFIGLRLVGRDVPSLLRTAWRLLREPMSIPHPGDSK